MRVRLFTLLVVPALASVVLAWMIVSERNDDYEAAERAFEVAVLAEEIAGLDKALGDEALAASKFVQAESDHGRSHRFDLYEQATAATDAELIAIEGHIAERDYGPEVTAAVAAIRYTLSFRSDIERELVSPLQILDRYSHVRGQLIDVLSHRTLALTTSRSQQHLLALVALVDVRSDHLDERVAVDLATRYNRWAPGLHSAVIMSIASQDAHLERANQRLAGEEVLPSDILQAWRAQIVTSDDAPVVSSRAWAAASDAWIADLDAAILEQRTRTTMFLAAVESSAAATKWATVLGLSIALLVAMAIAAVVSVRLMRRVTIITNQARRMASGAPTAQTYRHVRGSDELGQLAAAFDEMISHIDTRTRNQWIESTVLESIVQGSPVDEIMEQTAQLLGADEHGDPLYRFRRTAGGPDPASGSGEVIAVPIRDGMDIEPPDEAELRTALGLVKMAQQRDADHTKLAWQATRDELTGVLNRGAVLSHALSSGDVPARGDLDRGGPRPALLYLDLDDFKSVNDQFGHAAGDVVLARQATRLVDVIGGRDGVVGRLGGDEFLVVLHDVADERALQAVADELVEALRQPVPSSFGAFDVGVSIGSVLARPGVPALKLLNDADAALYEAKKRGRNKALVSTQALRDQIVETEQLRGDVQLALDEGRFTPWFQPIWGDGGTTLAGVEALARWDHPERGLVDPTVFVPVADELNLLAELDRQMFVAVCRHIVAWREAGHELGLANFNLSTAWLEEPDFVSTIREILAETGCPAESIVAEVTESGLMTDIRSNGHRLQALREMGIRIAVDDFGQGYSSLAYLSDLPVDLLKIDRRFVDRIDREPSNQAIVSAVINLGSSLGLTMIAEGVERVEELDYLHAAGCDLYQGYLLARPMPAAETTALIGRGRAVSEAELPIRRAGPEPIEAPSQPPVPAAETGGRS